MSFDYSPPRWWVPVAVVLALLALAVAAVLVMLLGYGGWLLIEALPADVFPVLRTRIATRVGPFR